VAVGFKAPLQAINANLADELEFTSAPATRM
jgi:hypothetical protein